MMFERSFGRVGRAAQVARQLHSQVAGIVFFITDDVKNLIKNTKTNATIAHIYIASSVK